MRTSYTACRFSTCLPLFPIGHPPEQASSVRIHIKHEFYWTHIHSNIYTQFLYNRSYAQNDMYDHEQRQFKPFSGTVLMCRSLWTHLSPSTNRNKIIEFSSSRQLDAPRLTASYRCQGQTPWRLRASHWSTRWTVSVFRQESLREMVFYLCLINLSVCAKQLVNIIPPQPGTLTDQRKYEVFHFFHLVAIVPIRVQALNRP